MSTAKYNTTTYQATITKSGQITISAAARKALGVQPGDMVTITTHGNHLTIERRLTDEEFLALLDSYKTPKTLAMIEKHRGKTASELMSEWAESPEGRAYFEEKYGPITDHTPQEVYSGPPLTAEDFAPPEKTPVKKSAESAPSSPKKSTKTLIQTGTTV